MSIQEAYQQANPRLFGAEAVTQKLKERSAIPYKVSWNGKISSFETYRRTIEAWVVQNGMRYMFKTEFLDRYVTDGWHTAHRFAGTTTEDQFQHDKEMLYGAIMASNKDNPAANKYINMYAPTADGLATWYCFMQDYGGLDNMI